MKTFSTGWATWVVTVFSSCGMAGGTVLAPALRVECVRDDAGTVTSVDGYWGSKRAGTATRCEAKVTGSGLNFDGLVTYEPGPDLPEYREFSAPCSLAGVPAGLWATTRGTPATITVESDGGVQCN